MLNGIRRKNFERERERGKEERAGKNKEYIKKKHRKKYIRERIREKS